MELVKDAGHQFAMLTPEKAVVTFRVAGLGARIAAQVIDVVLLLFVLTILLVSASFAFGLVDSGLATAISAMLSTAGLFLYFILFEGLWNGQTPGKKMFGIRVQMADGLPITMAAAVSRNLMRPADFLPVAYFAGLICIFVNERSQRLGDLVAQTMVVYVPESNPTFDVAPHQAGIHRLEDKVGDLPGMTMEEYITLKQLTDRFPELTNEVQLRMVRQFWQPLATRRKIPDIPDVHPIYVMEATVMRFGRQKGLM